MKDKADPSNVNTLFIFIQHLTAICVQIFLRLECVNISKSNWANNHERTQRRCYCVHITFVRKKMFFVRMEDALQYLSVERVVMGKNISRIAVLMMLLKHSAHKNVLLKYSQHLSKLSKPRELFLSCHI